MKFIRLINYLILFYAVLSTPLFADEDVLRPHGRPDGGGRSSLPVYIGIEGGLNINLYNANHTWYTGNLNGNAVPTIYEVIKDGNGLSPYFGAFIDFSFTKSIGFQLRLGWDQKYFGNSGDGLDNDPQFNMVEVPIGVDWNVTANYFTLTPLFRYSFNENFFMTLGPTFHFLMSDIKHNIDAETPAGAIDPNNTFWYPQMEFAFTPPAQVDTRVGIDFGLGYKFPIAKKVFLVPQGRIQIMLSEILKDTYLYRIDNPEIIYFTNNDRSLLTIQLALALMFEL